VQWVNFLDVTAKLMKKICCCLFAFTDSENLRCRPKSDIIFRLHRMHEMQTIVTDVRGVCLSVCLSRGSSRRRVQCVRGSFGAAFAKLLWPLVKIKNTMSITDTRTYYHLQTTK